MMALIARPALIVCLFAGLLPGSDRIDLNGEWQFRLDENHDGIARGWTTKIPPGVETVRVPHTWNIGKYADYEGTAWYFHAFEMPQGIAGKHVELQFDATFYRSRIWINGVELGTHEGGYTAYWFDITTQLRPRNLIAVELNNEPGMSTIPGFAMSLRGGGNVWYDWWHYGGIVRDVFLRVTEPVMIRRQQIRSRIADGSAAVTDRVFIENHGKQNANVRLKVDVFAPDGELAGASPEQTIVAKPGSSEAELSLRVEHPQFWHFDNPQVYRVRASAAVDGPSPETVTDNYGFRTIEIRDRRLYVNGERVRLSGLTRHEESPWEGLAETPGTMRHDYDEMKELQVTLTRPVHYPQHPFILDYADRNGILLVPEIPMWQFSEQQMQDPKVIALAKQMMTEMIEQDYNHPSILGWSVCNESETNKPGGRRYFEVMYDLVKKLDPDRYVSYADSHIAEGTDPRINAASVADFVMMNEYFGTWSGPKENLIPALDRANRDYPTKMFFISEFGAAGMFAPDKKAGDELRVRIMREQLEIFRKYDFIAGAILWCYQDYKSHRNLRPGERSGMVEMGIVDENRQRYPSFRVWQEENTPADVRLKWTYEDGRPVGFEATISRRGEDWLPSYNMHSYRAEWELRDATGALVWQGSKRLSDIGPPQTIEADWPVRSRGYRLRLRLLRPTGFPAWERSIDWWEGISGGDSVQEMEKRGIHVP
jgi:beta-glucuronidase